jgi:hypothetical protein
MNIIDKVVFTIVSPLIILFIYILMISKCSNLSKRLLKDNEYFLHIIFVTKSVLIL